MSEKSSIYPIDIDCGKKLGVISLANPSEVLEFIRKTAPEIARENDVLTEKNTELRKKIDAQNSKDAEKQPPISLNPHSVAFVPRANDRKSPTKVGELWDEFRRQRLDAQTKFDLSFPRGRYVTGFVGTLTLSHGTIPSLKNSLLWHEFFIDIKENKFWRGKILVQRRSEDEKYNIRSMGINDYVGR